MFDLCRELRKHKILTFAKPGNPGSKFKNQQEKILKCLSLPKGAKEELGITGEGENLIKVEDTPEKGQGEESKRRGDGDGEEEEEVDQEKKAEEERRRQERKMQAAIFGEGKYHLIPSFFRTLMYLKK